jgi:hypothetical protein
MVGSSSKESCRFLNMEFKTNHNTTDEVSFRTAIGRNYFGKSVKTCFNKK